MTREAPLLIVVGGFLGAGKTTLISRAALLLQARGMKVAVVTNDQAADLVDTAIVRQSTSGVAEIAGGCFCCRFDPFVQGLQEVIQRHQPDVVLAEAVGSCTDLAATVYQPLKRLRPIALRLGPLSVVVDGARLQAIHRGLVLPRLPTAVTYLYDRQLAEADVFLLNKTDLLDSAERADLYHSLAVRSPGAVVLPVSAAAGEGIDAWLDCFRETATAGSRVVDVDYDRYAEAEASLGWLNLSGLLTAPADVAPVWVERLLTAVQGTAVTVGAEIAHVKVWVESTHGLVRGHLVGTDGRPEVITLGVPASPARVILNARVGIAPESLGAWIDQAIDEANRDTRSSFLCNHRQAFRPSRPVPVHRLAPNPVEG